MRQDRTTPDTRLADDPMAFNPATVGNLVRLMLGGLPPKHQGEVLQARVRYFDPARRRPGLPEDVAALVDSLKPDATSIILVNLNPSEPRSLIVQGGGYGEHVCEQVASGGRTIPVHGTSFRVRLAPGAGGRLTIAMKRYAAAPTLSQPWEEDCRGSASEGRCPFQFAIGPDRRAGRGQSGGVRPARLGIARPQRRGQTPRFTVGGRAQASPCGRPVSSRSLHPSAARPGRASFPSARYRPAALCLLPR